MSPNINEGLQELIKDLDCGSFAERHRPHMLDSETCRAIARELEALVQACAASQPRNSCTCVPVTAAGVMVSDPHCPVHGTPRVTFTVKP